MFSLLLSIIYLTFVSLGLPDSLIGSGWPSMHLALNVPVSYAGILTIIISIGTVISSLKTTVVIKKLGMGGVVALSVGATAIALLGFSLANSFFVLCLLCIPYGLGAGAVDAALSNYVAIHYKARHITWLHCFWGVGASISPYIMGFSLLKLTSWRSGYVIVGAIQALVTLVLLCSLKLWSGNGLDTGEEIESPKITELLKMSGVKSLVLCFFAYCSLEQTAGLWATTFLVDRGVDQVVAATYTSYFYLGITLGRLFCGFIAEKFNDKILVRMGTLVAIFGVFIIFFNSLVPLGLAVLGLGCAPVYPAVIHSTPIHYGTKYSQAIIGLELASAYVGIVVAPAIYGFLSDYVGLGIYPVYLMFFAVLVFLSIENFNKIKKLEK